MCGVYALSKKSHISHVRQNAQQQLFTRITSDMTMVEYIYSYRLDLLILQFCFCAHKNDLFFNLFDIIFYLIISSLSVLNAKHLNLGIAVSVNSFFNTCSDTVVLIVRRNRYKRALKAATATGKIIITLTEKSSFCFRIVDFFLFTLIA